MGKDNEYIFEMGNAGKVKENNIVCSNSDVIRVFQWQLTNDERNITFV